MGIISFIKSQLIDIIEWLDDTNYTLVAPRRGPRGQERREAHLPPGPGRGAGQRRQGR
ncbi:MAG: hypothetical protein U0168_26600 [Nannocystaceae bacterium]